LLDATWGNKKKRLRVSRISKASGWQERNTVEGVVKSCPATRGRRLSKVGFIANRVSGLGTSDRRNKKKWIAEGTEGDLLLLSRRKEGAGRE